MLRTRAAVSHAGVRVLHRGDAVGAAADLRLRVMALDAGVTRVVINEHRLTLGVGSGFRLDPDSIPKLQSISKNRFRFGEGRITIDLPARSAAEQLPTLHALLAAL